MTNLKNGALARILAALMIVSLTPAVSLAQDVDVDEAEGSDVIELADSDWDEPELGELNEDDTTEEVDEEVDEDAEEQARAEAAKAEEARKKKAKAKKTPKKGKVKGKTKKKNG